MADVDWDAMGMSERGERFPEYDDQNAEELDASLDELRERLRLGDRGAEGDPSVAERITYIENLQDRHGTDEIETNLGGSLSIGRVRDDSYIQLDKFVQDTFSVSLDSHTDSVLELRNRISIKNGNIIFKEKDTNGSFSMVEKIVLNKKGDRFVYNTANRNKNAVDQFKELVTNAMAETTDRERTIASLPMIEIEGSRHYLLCER